MKRFVFFISVLLSAGSLMAQSTVETVYLKNGGLVKGEIIEQVPGQSLKVKTKDGNIFVYQMDEVERIAKESQTSTTNVRHRGLDFGLGAGYDINTKGGGGAIVTELELGKRFSKNFYWGLGAGANFATTSGGGIVVPITTNVKTYFPLENSSLAPFAMLKAGYALNTDNTDFSGILLSVMPGLQFPLSKTVDMNLGAGYTHVIYDGGSGGSISIRMGFGFHKNPYKPKLPPVPTRAKGFQVTLEGGKMGLGGTYEGFLGNMVLSYKLNPHLSIGIGGGSDGVDIYKDDGWSATDIHSEETRKYDVDLRAEAFKAFLRAQYRLSDKRISPLVSCDAGFRFYGYWEGDKGNKEDVPSTGIFVAPAVGLSLRTFNNSYLELKAGLSYSPSMKEQTLEYEVLGHEYHCERKKISLSAPYAMLSWTHTFGSRKR